MDVAIILYAICATAITVWCALRSGPAYVRITAEQLLIWQSERQNLIVIELSANSLGNAHRSIPDSLEVSEQELAGLLRCIPPRSTLVVCSRKQIVHFDRRIEEGLLRAAIYTTYVLDGRDYTSLGVLPRGNSHPSRCVVGGEPPTVNLIHNHSLTTCRFFTEEQCDKPMPDVPQPTQRTYPSKSIRSAWHSTCRFRFTATN